MSNYPGDRDDLDAIVTKACANCGKVVKTNDCDRHVLVAVATPAGRCPAHPAYDHDYCPLCSGLASWNGRECPTSHQSLYFHEHVAAHEGGL